MASPSSPASGASHQAPAEASQTAEPPSSASKQLRKPPAPRPTHFICLPLVTPTSRPQLASSLSLLRDALPPSIPQKVLRPVGTLHLTIGVCHLRGKAEVERARRVLKEDVDVLKLLEEAEERNAGAVTEEGEETTSSPAPLIVDLTSLYPMHSPKSTSVLFAAPHDTTNRLQRFSEKIRDAFIEKGILLPQLETVKVKVKEGEGEEDSETSTTANGDRRTQDIKTEKVGRERDLKLHATLVNGVYALERKKKRKGGGKGGGPAPSISPSSVQPLHPQPSTVSSSAVETPLSASPSAPPTSVPLPPSPTSSSIPRFSSKGRFDATSLLSRFADQVWARDVHIEAVELCEMGAKKVLDEETGKVVDEVYKVVARRELP